MADQDSPASSIGLPITCKAAVIWAPGEKFKIETIVVAPPRKDQVRIKILYSAICHTDVTFSEMQALAPLFPAILGHESSGIVESVGEGVTNVQIGDHVLPFMQGRCEGQCRACREDWGNTCLSRPHSVLSQTLYGDDQPHFISEDGQVLSHFFGLSTFTEYTVAHKNNVVKINPAAPLEKVCVLSCGVGTGIGAVRKVAQLRPGSTAAVFGLGTVGLAVVEGCRVAGASRIIGVDLNASKFETGKGFGLTDFINPKDHERPIHEVIKDMTGGGVDYSFECVGSVKVISDAMESTQGWGKTVVIGIPVDLSQKVEVSPVSIISGRSIIGTTLGGLRITDLPGLVDESIRKGFQLDSFVTHRLPLSKINEGFELFHVGKCLRCVLHMGM